MKHKEYRLSVDVDFMCSSRQGYSRLRAAVLKDGVRSIFAEPVESVRDFRSNHTGLRSLLDLDGQHIKFESVREGRIDLSGAMDPELGCPILSVADQCAEKLLANSDRDLIDLGMLALANGRSIPPRPPSTRRPGPIPTSCTA